MPRITIAFDDEQLEWVSSTADDLDRSKAEIVRAGVDALRGVDSAAVAEIVDGEGFTGAHHTGEALTTQRTTVHRDGDTTTVNDGEADGEEGTIVHQLVDRLDELEERVATLEADRSTTEHTVDERRPPDRSGSTGGQTVTFDGDRDEDERQGGVEDAFEPDDVDDMILDALKGWNPGRTPEEQHPRRESGCVVLQWLRDQDREVRKSDVVESLYESHGVDDQTEGTWWTETARAAMQHAAERGYVEDTGYKYEWVGDDRGLDDPDDETVYDPVEEFE